MDTPETFRLKVFNTFEKNWENVLSSKTADLQTSLELLSIKWTVRVNKAAQVEFASKPYGNLKLLAVIHFGATLVQG